MAPLPRRSTGMLSASLGDQPVLYDPLTETVHVLNGPAGLVWTACDGRTDLEDLATAVAEATGLDPAVVAGDVGVGVERLAAAGLVGRATVPPPAPRMPRHVGGADPSGKVCAVLDDGVRFRCRDPSLLADIDSLMASLHDARGATMDLTVWEMSNGTVRISGLGAAHAYSSRAAFLEALPSALNRVAASSSSCLALHAACVRSPAGEVLLLPATSGSGKTTLAAALVQAGWDYGTDEAVGVRLGSLEVAAYPKPLVLDPSSRVVLGLGASASSNTVPGDLRADVAMLLGTDGSAHRMVLPRYEPGAATSMSPPLPPDEALIAILEHVINLRLVRETGLVTLCQLAERVPVQRLVHGDVHQAAAALS